MSEVKDPKIKLFGKTIELAAETFTGNTGSVSEESSNLNGDEVDQESNKSPSVPKETDSKVEDQCKPSTSEDLKECGGGVTMKASKNKVDQNDSSDSQDQKALKKPDKIIPCPRCNSMETKFCYFNNYNVNQPRHFCRNCQRYWTAGGTMRNVPVGAGRRKKNQQVASQYHHITVPGSLSGVRVDLPNGLHNPPTNQKGAVLTFSSDTHTPLCESMVSGLSIGNKTRRNGFLELELSRSTENVESGPSLDMRPDRMPNCHSFPPTMPCFPQAPWPYPFYPAIGSSTFPVPIYPTAPPYWNCAVPGTWTVPLIVPPMPTAPSSGPISPTLGKHMRDETTLKLENGLEVEKESDSEKCLWVPKTLRIDDPREAAKSSIWATLGIKKDRDESAGVGSGKAFESKSKGDEKTHVKESSTVLQANPAALSRSISFHESS